MIAENAMLNARATARVARTIHVYRVIQAAQYCTGDPRGRPSSPSNR